MSSFQKGFLTGLAGGIEKGVQGSIDRHMEDLSDAKKYMRVRRDQEEARYREDVKKYRDTIEDLAAYVDTENLPEGATAFDIAGAYFENSLGGSVREAEAAIVKFRDAKNKLGDAGAKIVFTNANTQGLSAEDIGKKFVDGVDLDFIKGSEQKGTGLFFKNVDIREKAAESVTMPVDEQMSEIELGKVEGLGTKGAFASEEEYKRTKRKDELALESAILGNKLQQKQIDEYGAFDDNQIQEGFDRAVENLGEAKAIPIDPVTGTFQVKTGTQQYQDAADIHTFALQNLTKTLINNKSFGVGTNDSTIRGIATEVRAYLPNQMPPKATSFDDMDVGKLYTIKTGGEFQQILWTGDENNLFRID